MESAGSSSSSLSVHRASMDSASEPDLPRCGPLLCVYWFAIAVLALFLFSLGMVLVCVLRLRCRARRGAETEAVGGDDEDDNSDATVALLVRYREQVAAETDTERAVPTSLWARLHLPRRLPWRRHRRDSSFVAPPEPPSIDDAARGLVQSVDVATKIDVQTSRIESRPEPSATPPTVVVCTTSSPPRQAASTPRSQPCAGAVSVDDYEEPWQPIVVPRCAVPRQTQSHDDAVVSGNYLCDEVAPTEDILYRGAMAYGWASAKNEGLIIDDPVTKDGWLGTKSSSTTRPSSEGHEVVHTEHDELPHDRNWLTPLVKGG